MPFSPFGKGFLTGAIDETTSFDANDFRARVPRFSQEARKSNMAMVELVKDYAQRKGAAPAQIALAWILAHKPWMMVPLCPGCTSRLCTGHLPCTETRNGTLGGELFRIGTVKAYPADYDETTRVAKKELREVAWPALATKLYNIADYDTVILGYPNWWGSMPMAVYTFLESCDFSGKTILPFCTHEGSGMGHSESDIKRSCPGAKVLPGLSILGGNVQRAENDIALWLHKRGIMG